MARPKVAHRPSVTLKSRGSSSSSTGTAPIRFIAIDGAARQSPYMTAAPTTTKATTPSTMFRETPRSTPIRIAGTAAVRRRCARPGVGSTPPRPARPGPRRGRDARRRRERARGRAPRRPQRGTGRLADRRPGRDRRTRAGPVRRHHGSRHHFRRWPPLGALRWPPPEPFDPLACAVAATAVSAPPDRLRLRLRLRFRLRFPPPPPPPPPAGTAPPPPRRRHFCWRRCRALPPRAARWPSRWSANCRSARPWRGQPTARHGADQIRRLGVQTRPDGPI